eukprot:7432749-Pyramimonas_sp.AAC.1
MHGWWCAQVRVPYADPDGGAHPGGGRAGGSGAPAAVCHLGDPPARRPRGGVHTRAHRHRRRRTMSAPITALSIEQHITHGMAAGYNVALMDPSTQVGVVIR